MDKSIQVALAKVEDEIKKVVRRQDEMQRSLDLLFADRQILEDLQGSMKHLQEIILANQTHQDSGRMDLKADIADVQTAVSDKVDEVQLGIDAKTVILKGENQSIIEKITDKFKRKE